MAVIEFQTYIDHGTIALPKAYQDQLKGQARVIIVIDETPDEEDMVAFLLDNPYNVDEFTPLSREKIYER